jgi:peptidyl-prolyl cis-trans isomerase D
MAIIGDIRKRSGLLVGAIALSIFLFLLGDAVNNNFGVLKGGRSNDAGSINGQAIPYQDYSNQVNENVKNFETQYRMSIPEQQRNEISKQTWDDLVNNMVMADASARTGIAVSDDELVSLTTTSNLHPMLRQQLFGNNPVDIAGLNNFIRNLDIDEKGQEPGAKRKFWNKMVKEIKKSQIQSKYGILVAKGVGNVPDWMAESLYYDANRSADLKYVMLPYAEVNDNDIKYTDNDLKEYLNKNAGKFSTPDEFRNIRYVSFDIAPSAVDSAATLKSLTDRLDEFKKGAKKSDDSLFVKLYSETSFDDLYRTKDQFMGSAIADTAFALPIGTVVGPFVEGNMYKYAKISARKMLSDSVRVKEITFSYTNIKTQAEFNTKIALIDSIYKAIDSLHADFGAIAAAYSEDPASKNNGGIVGWVKMADPQLDEYYKSVVFHNGEIGKTYVLRDAQNVPIKFVQVIEDKPSKQAVKVAYFTRSIVPSQETENNIYNDVTQFVAANSTEDKYKAFMKAHEKDVKTAVRITRGSYDVMGLGSARSLVKWVFGAKRGDISPIITLGTSSNDRKHVVAYLESVTGKGTPELESVKDLVKLAYIQDKKYELLAKKVTDAKAATVDELASKLGKTAMEADKVTFLNGNLPTGNEPAVTATGVALAQGKISGPVKGNNGVYVVQKINGFDPPKPTDLTQQTMMLKQNSYMKARAAADALKKLAKIDDNRLNFEGGN